MRHTATGVSKRRHLVRRYLSAGCVAGVTGLLLLASAAPRSGAAVTHQTARGSAGPIQHVIIIYQENHSFDNLLGALCLQLTRCNGTTTGVVKNTDGTDSSFTMPQSPDIVPYTAHQPTDQTTAIDGGKMDGFNLLTGCSGPGYACVTQYQPSQIPNLAQLATNYVISDSTFEPTTAASFGAHIEIAASTLDGFVGSNPGAANLKGGWGCNTTLVAAWQASPGAAVQNVPTCIPKKDGTGPFEASPVKWVPTIMDRLSSAKMSWRIYSPSNGQDGYGWAICPTFADCLDTTQSKRNVEDSQFFKDASAGHLPAFSVVIPYAPNSQHNRTSMTQGDGWIAQIVSAAMSSPDWSSTAIFITYDDFGGFYDHVPPPAAGLGIRIPMVIVSPYAKASYDDPTQATFDSMLAFTEHVFGLAPLNSSDASAYDYSNSFTVTLSPNAPVPPPVEHAAVHLVVHSISAAERKALLTGPQDSPTQDDT